MEDTRDPQPPSAALSPKKEQLRWYVVFAWVLSSVALLALVTLGEWYRGVTALQQPPARPELAGPVDGLRALVWTDKGGVASSERMRLYVLCDNRTGGEVRDLHFLSFDTPGFEKIEDGCWDPRETPACSVNERTGAVRRTGLPRRLADGQVATVFASLRPRSLFGRHGASGLLVWKNVQGRVFQRAVILPGVEVHSALLDWISGLSKAVQVCALPIVLAFLGWYLKRRDDERKKQEEADKQERERVEAKEQEWRIRLQETWNLELPRVADNITAHYMPAASAIDRLLRTTRDLSAASSEEDLHFALYRLLRLTRRMAELAEQIGGFYFKDLDGEIVAGACWDLFQEASKPHFGGRAEEHEARVLDAITPQISLAQFMDLVKGVQREGDASSPAWRRQIAESLEVLTGCLQAWIAEQGADRQGRSISRFHQDLVPLEILLPIFIFEMNRPLEFWYGRLPPFPGKAFTAAVEKLDPGYQDLVKKLNAYGQSCEEAVREAEGKWRSSRQATGAGPRLPAV